MARALRPRGCIEGGGGTGVAATKGPIHIPPTAFVQRPASTRRSPRSRRSRRSFHRADAPGKAYLVSEGDTPIRPSPEQDALFKEIGEEDTVKVLKELDGKGLPATKVHTAMKAAADKYAKTSFSFWKA